MVSLNVPDHVVLLRRPVNTMRTPELRFLAALKFQMTIQRCLIRVRFTAYRTHKRHRPIQFLAVPHEDRLFVYTVCPMRQIQSCKTYTDMFILIYSLIFSTVSTKKKI